MAYRGVFSLSDIISKAVKGTGQPVGDVFIQAPTSSVNPFGYFSGGWDTVGSTPSDYLSSTLKMTFSTDAYSALPTSANLSSDRYGFQAASSDTTHYVSAGYVGSTDSYLSSTEKITFATETREAVPAGNQASSHWLCTGAVSTTSIAYFMGGYNASQTPSLYSYANKFTFSNETMSEIPGAGFPASGRTGFAMSGNSTAGYASAGVGDPWGNITITDKLTFSSDSTARVPAADTLAERNYCESVGNGTQMYMSGGDNPSPNYLSSTEKMVFADETYAAAPGAQMTIDRRYFSRLSGGAGGYLAGGQSALTPGFISSTDKLNYSTDTTSNISTGNLPGIIRNMGGSSSQENGRNYASSDPYQFTTGQAAGPQTGYAIGGHSPSATLTNINKTTYSSDTTALVPGANTDVDVYLNCGTGNRTHAYACGGGIPTFVSLVRKLTYSADTIATIPATLSAVRYSQSTGSTDDVGYLIAGYNPSDTWFPGVDRLSYSTDTVDTPGSFSYPYGKYNTVSNSSRQATYTTSGYSGVTNDSQIVKLTYSTNTAETIPTRFSGVPNQGMAGIARDDECYFVGPATFYKFDFASESSYTHPGATLNPNVLNAQEHGDTSVAYILGGHPYTDECQKFTYSTGSSSRVPSGNLVGGSRGYGSGRGGRSQNLPQVELATPTSPFMYFPAPDAAPPVTGYVMSGESPAGNLSSGVKLNMSTDAYSAVPSMSLPGLASPSGYRTYAASASSPTHGYMMGGYAPNFSNASKTEYVTETTSVVPGSTSEARRSVAQGGGSSSRGYMAGGYSEAQSPHRQVSNVDKLLYSSETFGRQPGANLTEQRGGAGSVSNQSRMLTICGNNGPASRSIVDRIDFASDTTDRIPGANDPQARQYCRSTYYPSPERGYTSGGRDSPSNTWYSLTTRFNFSDDTSSSVPGGNLSSARKDHMAIGNTTDGYQTGGNFPGGGGPNVVQSTTEKLNMSTETYATAPSANLDIGRHVGSGFGPYMNNNPSAPVPAPPNPFPVLC